LFPCVSPWDEGYSHLCPLGSHFYTFAIKVENISFSPPRLENTSKCSDADTPPTYTQLEKHFSEGRLGGREGVILKLQKWNTDNHNIEYKAGAWPEESSL
jgi:hypothetical protein